MAKFRIKMVTYVDVEANSSTEAIKDIFKLHMDQIVNNAQLVGIGVNEL